MLFGRYCLGCSRAINRQVSYNIDTTIGQVDMVKIFFSYSHKNEDMRNELEKHFSVMREKAL